MNAITFQIKLDTNIIQLPNASNFLGKEVIVTVVEIPQEAPLSRRTWHYLGSVHLNAQLDYQNIRDLAYE
mgnify:CR=1 FL=1